MKLISNLLSTFHKDLTYYGTYLSIYAHIQHGSNRWLTTKYLAIISFLVLQSTHQLYLATHSARLSEYDLLLHYNAPYLAYRNNLFNVIWTATGLMSALYYRMFYFTASPKVNAFLGSILLRGYCPLFAERTFHGVDVMVFLQQFAIKLANKFQFFVFIIPIYALSAHFRLINRHKARINFNYTSFTDVIFFYLSAILFYFLIYHFASINTLGVSLGNTASMALYILFKQANAILVRSSRPSYLTYYHFRSVFTRVLSTFFTVNQQFGRLFTIFLIVNYPLNAYLVTFLLTSPYPLPRKMPSICMATGQLFAIFGLHLVFSYYTKLIHASSKPLLALIVRPDLAKKVDLRSRIRLAQSIAALHVKNRYGKTYGRYGLITLNSFSKCLWQYCKFMMWAFKILERSRH